MGKDVIAGPRVVLLPWTVADGVLAGGAGPQRQGMLVAAVLKYGTLSPAVQRKEVEIACRATREAGVRLVFVLIGRGGEEETKAAVSCGGEDEQDSRPASTVPHHVVESGHQMRSVLRNAEIEVGAVILPQMQSGLGWVRGVAMQAVHAGLPVVGWNQAPLNETVTHCHDGLLLQPLPQSEEQDGHDRISAQGHAFAQAILGLTKAMDSGATGLGGRQPGLRYAQLLLCFIALLDPCQSLFLSNPAW